MLSYMRDYPYQQQTTIIKNNQLLRVGRNKGKQHSLECIVSSSYIYHQISIKIEISLSLSHSLSLILSLFSNLSIFPAKSPLPQNSIMMHNSLSLLCKKASKKPTIPFVFTEASNRISFNASPIYI